MCRSIKTLFNYEPAATAEEIRTATALSWCSGRSASLRRRFGRSLPLQTLPKIGFGHGSRGPEEIRETRPGDEENPSDRVLRDFRGLTSLREIPAARDEAERLLGERNGRDYRDG
jgi:hypothetical protein